MLTRPYLPVARRGNLQDLADRLDPEGVAMLIKLAMKRKQFSVEQIVAARC
ncbi:hypothetical protein [Paraburkholderia panacisoli]|jgi:hypothetical protein|uniref:hypothetical protein n=1 Tax=Paraburkholderia panacisoli TaxID=2603818 RepID=UPI00165F683A|nr:hypothetical protein [Paraburkholderia panacisoli]